MNHMPESVKFWLAVGAAILLRLTTMRQFSLWRACVTVTSALMFAVFFTAPTIHWWSLPPSTYEPAVAAVMALFGEHFARLIFRLDSLAAIIAAFRGK